MKRIFLTLAIITVTLYGCCEQPERKSSKKIKLRQLNNSIEKTESSSGFFFVIVGGYNSQSKIQTKVKMCILVNGYYKFIKIPIERLRIKINNSVENPYLIVEDPNCSRCSNERLTNNVNHWMNFNRKYIVTISEEYLPEKLTPVIHK